MKVPCWVCKGKFILEEGEYVDVGVGSGVQVSPDIECTLCDYGMIEIGSPRHTNYRKTMRLKPWKYQLSTPLKEK